jgi:NADPH:quinone reductase-like Zn-dependent oxidoreductase
MECAMKAVVYHNYGSPDNLDLRDIAVPAVEEGTVLVKVHAASVNWHDWHFLTGSPFMARIMAGGLLKPRNTVLGSDVAGRVEAVGSAVRHFRPGDEVFGSTRHGCFAEYVCVSEEEVVEKPPGITFEEAAAVGAAAATALQGLRDAGQIQSGQHVLVNGASGVVGSFAVQIAKAFGARVTGVCSTGNLDRVRSIGADRVIDYAAEDFTQTGQRYDLIFDVVAKRSFSECRRALGEKGIYVTTEFSPGLALLGRWTSLTGHQKMVPLLAKPPNKADLVLMKELLEAGQVTPALDRCYSLSEVPDALWYLGQGHARGKVVITVGGQAPASRSTFADRWSLTDA